MEKNKNLICRILMLCATVFFAYDVSAQTIKGHVEEASGVEIIGASIMEKGTTNGTVTDIDGNFQLNCKPGAKLVISYVGFTTQELAAVDGMKVVLQEDNTTLNEVVVIGYGSLAKKEISSSVVQINKDQFNQGAVQDPMGLVAGKVAGLNVSTTNDANPNAMSDIQVRGAGSLKASNGPLIVIDGIAGGDLRNVASQDVESITVLKDASSAAIYGTRGANGVILVTTKKGASGEGVTNVTYDSYIALNFAKPHFKMLSAEEYARSRRGVDYGGRDDWYDAVSRPVSYSLNQYVSLDGSHKNGYYSASLNYKKGNGLDITSGREEYGGRFVVEQRALNKLLTFNTSLSARRVHEDWGNDGMFNRALTLNPTFPIYNPDGSYYKTQDGTSWNNPVSILKDINNKGDRTYILGNADVKLQILRNEHHNLNTSISYALQYNDLKSHYYKPSRTEDSDKGTFAGAANVKYEKWWTNRLEWLGNYILSLKDHELKAMIGYSWERSKYEGHYVEDKDFIYDNLDYFNIGKGTYQAEGGKNNIWASKTESTLIGFFGRLNYNWRDMLFASASLRHEGNTRFGRDRKWGNFPAASIAWEITRTPGLEKLGETFQSLKPRISYGVTGRSEFELYKSLNSYSANPSLAYYMDDAWITGYVPSINANPKIGWEKASSFNIGVDVVAFNGRLRGSIEYYDRRSPDLIWDYTAPQPPFIYDKITVNVGTSKNTGFELSADFDVFNKKPFTWTTGINYSYGTTKMTKLSSDIYRASYIELYSTGAIGGSENYFRIEEGGKVGQFYGYEYAGIDETGSLLVYNQNNEVVPINLAKNEDKRYIGNGAPKHFLSWTNSFTYKNFDLSFLFRGAFGFDIFNKSKYDIGLRGSNGLGNVMRVAYLDNKEVKDNGGKVCSYYLEKGDYFKLDNVTLGYTFTPKNRHLLESLRVYLTAKNLFTITGYKGHDPSIVPQNGITPGVDETGAYPQATQVSLGLTVKFH